MNAVEILTKARDLIKNPSAWVKGTYSGTQGKKEVNCYCAMGALRAVQGSCFTPVNEFLVNDRKITREHITDSAVAHDLIVNYNDKKKTTKKDILALFARAIKRAQKAGA